MSRVPLSVSLRALYVSACAEAHCKVNSGVAAVLPGEAGKEDQLTRLDLSTNIVGRTGLGPILCVVASAPSLRELNLADNYLNNDNMRDIVRVVASHPTLTTLSLAANPISHAGGKQLQQLASQNTRLRAIDLKGTLVNPALVAAVAKRCTEHRTDPAPTATTAASAAPAAAAKTPAVTIVGGSDGAALAVPNRGSAATPEPADAAATAGGSGGGVAATAAKPSPLASTTARLNRSGSVASLAQTTFSADAPQRALRHISRFLQSPRGDEDFGGPLFPRLRVLSVFLRQACAAEEAAVASNAASSVGSPTDAAATTNVPLPRASRATVAVDGFVARHAAALVLLDAAREWITEDTAVVEARAVGAPAPAVTAEERSLPTLSLLRGAQQASQWAYFPACDILLRAAFGSATVVFPSLLAVRGLVLAPSDADGEDGPVYAPEETTALRVLLCSAFGDGVETILRGATPVARAAPAELTNASMGGAASAPSASVPVTPGESTFCGGGGDSVRSGALGRTPSNQRLRTEQSTEHERFPPPSRMCYAPLFTLRAALDAAARGRGVGLPDGGSGSAAVSASASPERQTPPWAPLDGPTSGPHGTHAALALLVSLVASEHVAVLRGDVDPGDLILAVPPPLTTRASPGRVSASAGAAAAPVSGIIASLLAVAEPMSLGTTTAGGSDAGSNSLRLAGDADEAKSVASLSDCDGGKGGRVEPPPNERPLRAAVPWASLGLVFEAADEMNTNPADYSGLAALRTLTASRAPMPTVGTPVSMTDPNGTPMANYSLLTE